MIRTPSRNPAPRQTLPVSSVLSLLLVAAAVLTLAAVLPRSAAADDGVAPESAAAQAVTPGEDYVEGQVLVQLRGEKTPQAIEVPAGADEEQVAAVLEDRPEIESASANYVARVSGWLPNDAGRNPSKTGPQGGWQKRQWNMLPCYSLCYPGSASNTRQSRGGANVIRAWQHLRKAGRAGARGVRIAVLDSGIAYRNRGKNFRKNPDFRSKTFRPGFDFVQRDRIPLDLNGHGTHVAATIAQATNNRRGLTGIAFRSKLIPVRVMDANGFGTTLNIVKGIRWAANNGARVINMSLNFACGDSIPALDDALQFAHRKGVILVGSAGNIGSQECASAPATSPGVISVGGNTESGCVGAYSFKSDEVDITAPGGGTPREGCPFSSPNRGIFQVAMVNRDPRWFGIEGIWVGTSMSAAHVSAGAGAVLASGALGDKRGPKQVRERLLSTARLPGFAEGQPDDTGFGAGILDLGRATNPAVTPGA